MVEPERVAEEEAVGDLALQTRAAAVLEEQGVQELAAEAEGEEEAQSMVVMAGRAVIVPAVEAEPLEIRRALLAAAVEAVSVIAKAVLIPVQL